MINIASQTPWGIAFPLPFALTSRLLQEREQIKTRSLSRQLISILHTNWRSFFHSNTMSHGKIYCNEVIQTEDNQFDNDPDMPRTQAKMGKKAPNFKANSTEGMIDLFEWLGDSWGIVFSHPAPFTPICTTEMGSIAKHYEVGGFYCCFFLEISRVFSPSGFQKAQRQTLRGLVWGCEPSSRLGRRYQGLLWTRTFSGYSFSRWIPGSGLLVSVLPKMYRFKVNQTVQTFESLYVVWSTVLDTSSLKFMVLKTMWLRGSVTGDKEKVFC